MMGRDALLIDLAGKYTAMCRERVGGLFVAEGDSVASGEPAADGAAAGPPTAAGGPSYAKATEGKFRRGRRVPGQE